MTNRNDGELHPFLQLELDEEPSGIRRLVWLLQIKRATPKWPNKTRKLVIAWRDKQMSVLKSQDYSLAMIEALTRKYLCYSELVNN